jgi:hypothetical protein
MPRWCPVCRQPSITGHGRRRQQAHDDQHDWICVRRSRCPLCKQTFTVLPTWSPPYGHYSYCCRQQAWEEGDDHPDRDAQFRYINRAVKQALRAGEPVVDTKKME